MLRAFVDGKGRHRVAGQYAGIPALPMPRIPKRLDHRHRRDQEGRRRQVPPDLLQHDPGLDMAEAHSAIRLVDQNAGKAYLGELLPQAMPEAVLAIDRKSTRLNSSH